MEQVMTRDTWYAGMSQDQNLNSNVLSKRTSELPKVAEFARNLHEEIFSPWNEGIMSHRIFVETNPVDNLYFVVKSSFDSEYLIMYHVLSKNIDMVDWKSNQIHVKKVTIHQDADQWRRQMSNMIIDVYRQSCILESYGFRQEFYGTFMMPGHPYVRMKIDGQSDETYLSLSVYKNRGDIFMTEYSSKNARDALRTMEREIIDVDILSTIPDSLKSLMIEYGEEKDHVHYLGNQIL